jgi:hypothetical protein
MVHNSFPRNYRRSPWRCQKSASSSARFNPVPSEYEPVSMRCVAVPDLALFRTKDMTEWLYQVGLQQQAPRIVLIMQIGKNKEGISPLYPSDVPNDK